MKKLSGITIGIALASVIAAVEMQAQEATATPATEAPALAGATAGSGAATQKADTEIDGVTAELVSATRTDGDTVTIKFKFSNGGQKKAELDLTGYSPDNLAAKIYYIDAKNKKKYLPVTDAAGEPICSTFKGNTKLDPGESKAGWTKFPAPPAGVATISVYLPGTPPFEGVSLAAK
jgi:hypothetical protein